jgi:hypothetical protein
MKETIDSRSSSHRGEGRSSDFVHALRWCLCVCVLLIPILLSNVQVVRPEVTDGAGIACAAETSSTPSNIPSVTVVSKPRKVTWRQRARATLVQEGIYSRSNYELLVHCVMRESGGHADARNGQYLGVLQFGKSWKGTYKQKTSVEWSFHRWSRVYKKAGKHGIWKHWCRWHGCGRHY